MTPTADDILSRAHVVVLPMAVRFRGITVREALLIDGPAGWGEFSPFVEYEPAEAAAWLASGIEAAFTGLPEASGWVEVNGTIPATDDVEAVLERFPGVSTFKLKVAESSQSLTDDLRHLTTLHTLRPNARIRVDANRAWSVDEAVEAAHAFAKVCDLEYIEQPCATAEELAEVRRRLASTVATPIAADESIRRAEDPFKVAQLGAADVAVCKVAPLGGVGRLCGVVDKLGLDVTVASALDTAVGMDAGLVAAKLTGSRAAGLATQRLFVEDVAAPRPVVDGRMEVTRTTPDPARLHELRAGEQRRDWWYQRVRDCLDFL